MAPWSRAAVDGAGPEFQLYHPLAAYLGQVFVIILYLTLICHVV